VQSRLRYLCVLTASALACARQAPRADSTRSQANGSASPAAAASNAPTQAGRRTILFVGTSLTAGYGLDPDSAYPLQVQRMIDSAGLDYSVINAGVSGETSSALLNRLDWLMRQPFDVIVIETGANDGLRGVPVDAMAANVQRIVERVQTARPAARIVLVQMEAPPNLGTGYTRRFHEVFPDVARRTGATLMPFLLLDVAGVRELNQADGIHPNYTGERIVARNVWKALRPLLDGG
jgi:acyl-CoA thioesterase-1